MEVNKIIIWIFTISVVVGLSMANDKSSKYRLNTHKQAKGIKKPSLSAARVGEMYDACNQSSDCNEPWELYQCQEGYGDTYECNCYYRYLYVAAKGKSMCLGYAYLHGHCGYDEHCYSSNTYCSPGGTCECKIGFAIDESGDCNFDYFWTAGKITAVSLGSVVAFFGFIGIIGFIIYECTNIYTSKPRLTKKNLS